MSREMSLGTAVCGLHGMQTAGIAKRLPKCCEPAAAGAMTEIKYSGSK